MCENKKTLKKKNKLRGNPDKMKNKNSNKFDYCFFKKQNLFKTEVLLTKIQKKIVHTVYEIKKNFKIILLLV